MKKGFKTEEIEFVDPNSTTQQQQQQTQTEEEEKEENVSIMGGCPTCNYTGWIHNLRVPCACTIPKT